MSQAPGPVSTVLTGEVEQWLRQHSLVLWLDADGHYSEFVERLISQRADGQLSYDVYTFRGSHLELMLELEEVTGGIDRRRVLIHLPGFNSETIKATPLLELYRAGSKQQKALRTLVSDAAAGRVPPDGIAEFLQRGEPTLEAADQWLHDLLTTGAEGLASQLRNCSLIELVEDLLHGKRATGPVTAAIEAGDARAWEVAWDRATALTGIPASWKENVPTGSQAAQGLACEIAGWALCVSYVHDLTGPPRSQVLRPIPALPETVKQACRELATHLQQRHADFYRQTADETESRLEEVGNVSARELGRIDTFRFEEEVILRAALEALQQGDWEAARDWAQLRSSPDAFWLRDDPLRRNVWQLVGDAARLGVAITEAGPALRATGSLQAAVDEYVAAGAKVDQAHRHLEQNRQRLLKPQMPEFAALRASLDRMQPEWCRWADAWASGFNNVCRTHGFLPEAARQQRNLFEEEIRPRATEHGPVAYFVVDALRYEMGQELFAAIEETEPAACQLDWRLAELPTVTEVGMNVLAPVAKSGRLRPDLVQGKIAGFSTGEFRVSDPKSRKRAMHDRIGGGTCPWLKLEEAARGDVTSLKRSIARARLIVVHSREIDESGEGGFGPVVFENVMQDLRSAWHLLREAGIQHFVFTADHGFLLIDEATHTVPSHHYSNGLKPRYVISSSAADHKGEARVPLRDLDYDDQNLQLMFPETAAVFDTGTKQKGFTHGGNSFQERVIPVLTVSHRAPVGGSTTEYAVTAARESEVAGMHCLSGRVAPAMGSLDFGSSEKIDLGLRVPDAEGVRVELCDTRGGAKLASGTVVATVGERFELFFRLAGSTDVRVQVELYHPGQTVNVLPFTLKQRFEVFGTATEPKIRDAVAAAVELTDDWLSDLPEGPVRRVFQHLTKHGTVTEAEAAEMLGGPREHRRFARKFEQYAASAPFTARIDVISGVKRYMREGAAK